MQSYEYYAPTRLVFGPGRHHEIGQRLAGYIAERNASPASPASASAGARTTRVLLVYGGGSIRRTGLYDDVCASLRAAGVEWLELSGVRSNPTLEKVGEGVALCREHGVGLLLAVGGGSVIDTAKGIAMGYYHEGSVWDFFDGTAAPTQALPVATVVTVPGTASETSRNIVLSNEETREKVGVAYECLRPFLSILDPQLCTTVPRSLVAPGLYDALSHTMERYLSETTHADTTYGIAEGVMRSLLKNAPRVYDDPSDVDTWGDVMLAADMSHNSITGFGLSADWSNHGIEETVSGLYPELAHGAGLSIVTPAWMRYVYQRHLPVFVRFAVNVMGVRGDLADSERTALEGIEALETWSRRMGLPLRLSEVGIDDEHLRFMAERVVSYGREGAAGQRVIGGLEPLTADDVENIYRMAL